LTTTVRAVEEALLRGVEDFSPCHGLSGNAEVLLEAAFRRVLAGGQDTAESVARTGLEAYAGPGHPWPCGTRMGETPSFMLGISGIGYFYLRITKGLRQ
jgi:lantibiotic modifying enzyme